MKAITILLGSLLLGGCASMLPNSSYESSEISPIEMQTLALDGSAMMAARYPAGKTILTLQKNGEFGERFAEALRKQGFAVSQENEGMVLNYLLSPLDSQSIHLGLITHDWRSDALYIRQAGKLKRQSISQRTE